MKIDRAKIWAKFGGKCAYCGCEISLKDMQIGHIKPKRSGGTDDEGTELVIAERAFDLRVGKGLHGAGDVLHHKDGVIPGHAVCTLRVLRHIVHIVFMERPEAGGAFAHAADGAHGLPGFVQQADDQLRIRRNAAAVLRFDVTGDIKVPSLGHRFIFIAGAGQNQCILRLRGSDTTCQNKTQNGRKHGSRKFVPFHREDSFLFLLF